MIEQGISYLGRPNHIRLSNSRVELLISTDYGPRIVRFATESSPNVLGELPPPVGAPSDRWHIYGGHRLWHAPEHAVRTYWPDNRPVAAELGDDRVILTQEVEGTTRLQKRIEVTLSSDGCVTVDHRIENQSFFEVEFAVWALTVMAPGGQAIFPNAPFAPHPEGLLPARPLVLWPYTRLDDPRYTFGDRLFRLRQDPAATTPQKVGFFNAEGWSAYRRGRELFLKEYDPKPGVHADFGCNTEAFTNGAMLELETLGPLARIAPGEEAHHRERWSLLTDVEPDDSEEALTKVVAAMRGLGQRPRGTK